MNASRQFRHKSILAWPDQVGLLLLTAAMALACGWSAGALAGFGDTEQEYLRQFKALDPKDVNGHFALAGWCREQGDWQLVVQQCRYVLRIAPNHEQARLLLSLARQHLAADSPDAAGGSSSDRSSGSRSDRTKPPKSDQAGPSRPRFRALTDEEVQRIRRAELFLDEPERVTVRIDRKKLKKFYERAHAAGQLSMDLRAFLRLNRVKQAQYVLKLGNEEDRSAVEIRNDPERMREFDRRVQLIVLRGCASSDCHGGPSAGGLRLHAGRTRSANTTYANFYYLHEYEKNGRRLINRDQPDQSLLLSFGLPAGQQPPGTPAHPTPIKPVFRSTADRAYQEVLDWLFTLSAERPDYGIDLSAGKSSGSKP